MTDQEGVKAGERLQDLSLGDIRRDNDVDGPCTGEEPSKQDISGIDGLQFRLTLLARPPDPAPLHAGAD